MRGACSRLRTAPHIGQREQAPRTPYASRNTTAPLAPPVQFVPCSPGNLRKKTTISDIVIQRAGGPGDAAKSGDLARSRRAGVLSVRTAHFEQDCLCKCSKPAPPGTWLFSRTKRKLPHISLICVHLRHLRLRSFCSAFWLWLRRTKSLWLIWASIFGCGHVALRTDAPSPPAVTDALK